MVAAMVGSTTSAGPELCVLARLLSDLVTLDNRLAKAIPDGAPGRPLRALDAAARGGIAPTVAFVRPRLTETKHHPVLFVLARVERYAFGMMKGSQGTEAGGPNALRAVQWTMKALLDVDPRLALWAFGVAGNALASALSDDPPLDAMHRTLDLIAGIPEQSAAPIVLISRDPDVRERIAAAVLEAVLVGSEKRERLLMERLQMWAEQCAVPWFKRACDDSQARDVGVISMSAARRRQRVPLDAFCAWMSAQLLGSIRDYPAR